jgi:DNA relaxase NicK
MRFDWYQATIPNAHQDSVMEVLSRSDFYGDWKQARPQKGYDKAADFIVADEVFFRLNYGGQNEEFGPNVLGSGSHAPKLAQVIREHFPHHRVSRVDSCEDYHHPDVYAYLRKKALKVAVDHKLKVREITKPIKASDDGRTLYLGSPTSAISGRIYEKGKQLGVSTEWVRAEIQVRPQKIMKDLAAQITPEQVWSLAKWSHALAVKMGHKDLKRVNVQIHKPSDHERAYLFMLKQYRKVLEQMNGSHGSWEAVGAQIGYDLENMEELLRKPALKPV